MRVLVSRKGVAVGGVCEKEGLVAVRRHPQLDKGTSLMPTDVTAESDRILAVESFV